MRDLVARGIVDSSSVHELDTRLQRGQRVSSLGPTDDVDWEKMSPFARYDYIHGTTDVVAHNVDPSEVVLTSVRDKRKGRRKQ